MLKIETWKDNEILRKISEEVEASEVKKYLKLWKDMIKYLKDPDNNWVWLAAPQVWVNKRMIAVSLFKEDDDESYATIMMINPKIMEHSDTTEIDEEWCLSIPWEKGKVCRYSEIKLKFLDMKWKEKTLILNWLNARIVQHEIDHLNGVLFTDKIAKD